MEKREEALSEALEENCREVEKWERYINENTDAINNMNEFIKHISLDVMVPIGRRAIMYGQLIHTNEVLVSHYQGYFSKCSASKAKTICELRISKAKEHLKKLEIESNLWKNNLEKPYIEGALPNSALQEIIEQYDEKEELLWRQQHKINIRKAKLQEIEQKQNVLHEKKISANNDRKTDEEILQMLEEAELEEELQQELEKLEINEITDETIRQLMNGEIDLPAEKKRIAHNVSNEEIKTENKTETETETVTATQTCNNNNNDKEEKCTNQYLHGVVKITKNHEMEDKVFRTNNNIQPNPEFTENSHLNEDNDDDQAVDEEDDEENYVSNQLEIIKNQIKYLNPPDQIRFLEYQIEIYQQKISSLKINSNEDICEKLKLLNLLDKLQDFFELINDQNDNIEDTTEGIQDLEIKANGKLDEDINANADYSDDEQNAKLVNNMKSFKETLGSNRKKKISFNLENETLEFDKRKSVSEMISKPIRDIIKLDNNSLTNNLRENEVNKLDKESLRRKKIEENRQHVIENQSCQDFDLIGQILKESQGQFHTLYINFEHSSNEAKPPSEETNTDIQPSTPGDIYNQYLKYLQQKDNNNSSTTDKDENQIRTPLLKEIDRALAYSDPKLEFSIPNGTFKTKSILRNNTATETETETDQRDLYSPKNGRNIWKNPYKIKHKPYSRPTKRNSNNHNNDDNGLSAYYKVMQDVIEKPYKKTDELLLLPETQFIDTHAPKKRISRFKQMQSQVK